MLNDNKQTNKFSNVHAGNGIAEIKKEAVDGKNDEVKKCSFAGMCPVVRFLKKAFTKK